MSRPFWNPFIDPLSRPSSGHVLSITRHDFENSNESASQARVIREIDQVYTRTLLNKLAWTTTAKIIRGLNERAYFGFYHAHHSLVQKLNRSTCLLLTSGSRATATPGNRQSVQDLTTEHQSPPPTLCSFSYLFWVRGDSVKCQSPTGHCLKCNNPSR